MDSKYKHLVGRAKDALNWLPWLRKPERTSRARKKKIAASPHFGDQLPHERIMGSAKRVRQRLAHELVERARMIAEGKIPLKRRRVQLEPRHDSEVRKGTRKEGSMPQAYRLPDQNNPNELCNHEERLRLIDEVLHAWRPYPFNPQSEGSDRVGKRIEEWRKLRDQRKD